MGFFKKENRSDTVEKPAQDRKVTALTASVETLVAKLDQASHEKSPAAELVDRLSRIESDVKAVQLDVQNMFDKTNNALQRMNKRRRDLMEREDEDWGGEPEPAVAVPEPALVTKQDLDAKWRERRGR